MTQSPETLAPPQESLANLLQEHDSGDRYGYMAQAAAILSWNQDEGTVVCVAQYASKMRNTDPKFTSLMDACFSGLDTAAQWELLAYEQENGGETLPIDAWRQMGEERALLEEAPGQSKDWLTLSRVYISQLRISAAAEDVPASDIENVDIALSKLRDTPGNEHEKKQSILAEGNMRRMAVHALLKRGLFAEADMLAESLTGSYKQEYADSITLYTRINAGKPLAAKHVTQNNWQIMRELAPEVYAEVRQDRLDIDDLTVLLRLGRFEQAQQVYDAHIGIAEDLTTKLRVALEMAAAIVPESYNQAELKAIDGSVALETQAGFVKSDMESLVAAAIGRTGQLRKLLIKQCVRVAAMPLSTKRVECALQAAAVQRTFLADSEDARTECDQLLLKTWKKAVDLFMNPSNREKYRPQLQELWERYNSLGFDTEKLESLDKRFVQDSQPIFST